VKPGLGDVAFDSSTTPMYKRLPGASVPKNTAWGALPQYNNTLAFPNLQVVPIDIASEAGLERPLFQAAKQYEGHVDMSMVFPEPRSGSTRAASEWRP
jgi:putative aldouronate transport system substrate-binding protein